MRPNARVVLGMPTYNGSEHLREALDSLLDQRFVEFSLIVVDDASIDGTPEILQQYADRDPRIRLFHNEHRIGMIANWRRCFEYAEREHGDFELFAWVSDHDAWHPRWLKCLVETLDADPTAVVAYPETLRKVYDKADWRPWLRPFPNFDSGNARGLRRFLAVRRGMFAGSMVYGLFRVGPLKACGVFRPYLEPDRLLLLELSLMGHFRQVNEVLYYRQRFAKPTRERQRTAMFAARVPWTGRLSPQTGHVVGLLTSGAAPHPQTARAAAAQLALAPRPRAVITSSVGRLRVVAERSDLPNRSPVTYTTGRLAVRLVRAVVRPAPAPGRPSRSSLPDRAAAP